jgi:shikimate dehydrogenase
VPIHRIGGGTTLYFVLGHPVAQVRAPEVFNPIFAAHGIDAVLVPAAVPPVALPAFITGSVQAENVGGLWLTIPHKAAVLPLLSKVDEQGTLAGAVNAVRKAPGGALEGALFDGLGLVASLDHVGVALAGRRVLLVGTGGAGMAIAVAIAARPVAELALFDMQPQRAAATAERLSAGGTRPVRAAAQVDPAGFDVVVHATPLGMRPDDPLPFDVARLSPGATVVDILMKPAGTPLQRACDRTGVAYHPGFEMLTQQVPAYLRFFGHDAVADTVDLEPVRRRVRALAED